jgi:hypothetical protein
MATLRILFFGDICGRPGREAVKKILPAWQKEHRPDFVIANIENIAHGTGVTREKAEEMRSAGVDGFTLGDHAFDIEKAVELLAEQSFPIIRPMNWIGGVPGRGWRILKKNGKRLLMLNVLGRVFIRIHADDPFTAVESALKEASKEGYDASLLDCHAEATSEKRAMAEVFDGRISATIGTHTHVQTADAQTLPHGSGFLSDAGFSGPMDSVLGVKKEIIIDRMRTQRPAHHEPAEGACVVCGCLITVDGGVTTVQTLQERGISV